MEAYQSEFCGEDEFYNILETISPFAATMNEVEFCPRCKSAPCTCMKVSGFNFKKSTGTISNKKSSSSSKEVEDYSISASLASELPPVASATNRKTRTVGIVEPRVVVKIPWTKIGRKTLPQENYATKQMHSVSPLPAAPDPPNAIKVYQSDDCWRSQSDLTADDTPDATSPEKNFPQGATLEGDGSSSPATSPVLLVSAGTTHIIRQPISSQAKMKTNGSQSSHIQVDRHTIETALDDEVAASFPNNNNNCNEGKTCHSSRVKRRKLNGKMPTNATATTESEPDLLDILDNFLISTSNAEHAEAPPPEQQRFISSHPRSESITNVSSPVQQMLPPRGKRADGCSIKFTFEEEHTDEDDVEGKQWMFCHVPGCSFWTSKSFRMQRHKLCHSEPSELEVKRCYKCPDCHLKFYSLAKLLKHDRRKHTGIKDYECRICGAEVTDIQTHMRIHADEKNHFCEHCPLSFRHKSSLVRHMFLHTGERPYRCQSCQSSFTARDRLKGHILKHHPDHPAAQELHSLSKQQQAQHHHPSKQTHGHEQCRKRKQPPPPSPPPSQPPLPPPSVDLKGASTQCMLSGSELLENGENNVTIQPATTTANIILQWPATLQVGSDGNLCWQAAAASLDAGTHFNEVSTVSTTPAFSQILIQQETPTAVATAAVQQQQVMNPLDVAIKEIIEVDPDELDFASQMSKFASKLKALRQQQQQQSNLITVGEATTTPPSALPKEATVFVCDKCGREYKYKSFLQVHQKRKCW